MPPFGPLMNDEEVAAVVSYVRASWGNQGAAVGPGEVSRYRSVPLE
jgi:mono/diheme cytochrome c family protein